MKATKLMFSFFFSRILSYGRNYGFTLAGSKLLPLLVFVPFWQLLEYLPRIGSTDTPAVPQYHRKLLWWPHFCLSRTLGKKEENLDSNVTYFWFEMQKRGEFRNTGKITLWCWFFDVFKLTGAVLAFRELAKTRRGCSRSNEFILDQW